MAAGVDLTFASYNIHKGVGLDGRRDPERILAVLREIDADVVALQEADRRFGGRAAVLSRHAIEHHTDYQIAPLKMTPDGMAWHGNTLLVRRGIAINWVTPIPLPTLEPRGAVCAELRVGDIALRVVGMHLGLSGLHRRGQLRAVLAHVAAEGACPTVLLGDFNEWSPRKGALRELGAGWHLPSLGKSYPTSRPLAPLDRIVPSPEWRCLHAGVHNSRLAAVASDHLPVFARLQLGAQAGHLVAD
jgi:endonuclease/exonuclease/phosphatase family metal-dependent hydrolase